MTVYENIAFVIGLVSLLTIMWILLNLMEDNYEMRIADLKGEKVSEKSEFKRVIDKSFPFIRFLWTITK